MKWGCIKELLCLHNHLIHEIMGGDCDFLLKVVCDDLNAYRKFQNEYLTRKIGIQNIKTEIPMQNIKSTTEIPV